jgi:hypothetical protein
VISKMHQIEKKLSYKTDECKSQNYKFPEILITRVFQKRTQLYAKLRQVIINFIIS